jgi:hypothetical protein
MSFKNQRKTIGLSVFVVTAVLIAGGQLLGYELFLYRLPNKSEAASRNHRITLHGEFFGQLQAPSTFPSYNDLTGPADRWTMGFHNYLLITPTTRFHAQLVTHDRGGERTKFDWHFSLRQELGPHLALELGHDSDHDSDHTSYLRGRPYYTNRNYVGLGAPFGGPRYLMEPVLRFFHHTNQRTYLDLTGEKLKQEYGLRLGASLSREATLSFQTIVQADAVFGHGETWLADIILRFRLAGWLEATAGGSLWKDRGLSPAGRKQTFSKLFWGVAIPF